MCNQTGLNSDCPGSSLPNHPEWTVQFITERFRPVSKTDSISLIITTEALAKIVAQLYM